MAIFKNKKIEFLAFSAIDYYSLKERFEEMAKQGWLIDKVIYNRAVYKKIEATDLVFSVDIYPDLNNYEVLDKDDLKSYIDLCKDAGWIYITSANNLHIFYSLREEQLIPIQTDDDIKEKIVEKTITRELIAMTMALLSLIIVSSTFYPFNYENLFTNFEIIYPITIPILIFNMLFSIIVNILWTVKAKKNIRENKPLPKTNYKYSQISSIILGSISYLSIFVVAIALILDSFYGGSISKVFLLPLILFPIVNIVYNKKVKALKMGKAKKITILSVMVLSIYIIPITLGIISLGNRLPENLEPGHLGFTYTDFNIEGTPRHKYFSKSRSILVPRKSEYSEVSRGNGVETIFVESRNQKIANYIFDGYIRDEYEHNRYIRVADEYKHYDEAYYIVRSSSDDGDKNEVMLLNDNKILILYTDLDLSRSEYITIIDRKFKD